MIREDQSAEGVEGRGMGRGYPSPFEWVWGSFVSSPAGSGAESRSKTVFDAFWSQKSHPRHHFYSKTDTPKDMVGVPVLKLLRQWPIGVLAPSSMCENPFAPPRRSVLNNVTEDAARQCNATDFAFDGRSTVYHTSKAHSDVTRQWPVTR